jgi:hypothetical protein
MFFSITTDVGEQVYQNGEPSHTRTMAIDQAEFLAPNFDSLGRINRALFVPERLVVHASNETFGHRNVVPNVIKPAAYRFSVRRHKSLQ